MWNDGRRTVARFDAFVGRGPLPRSGAIRESKPETSDLPDPHSLARTVETEIVPRLMLLHREADPCGVDVLPRDEDVARFASIVLNHDFAVANAYVAALRANGTSLESIFLKLLAPTARLIGDLWREDLYSFAEVTIALSQLQQILRSLSDPFIEIEHRNPNGRRALIAPTPGEQHSFGVSVVDSFLRRAGWEVDVAWGAREQDIAGAVGTHSYDLVGFSLSCDVLLGRLASTIETLRRAAGRHPVKVIVGGRYFVQHPDMATRIGADAAALDAKDAVRRSERFFAIIGPSG